MSLRLHIALLLALSIAGLAIAVVAWDWADRREAQLAGAAGGDDGLSASLGRPLGEDVTLLDQDGRAVRLADFTGKVRMIFFGFTHCPDVCPTGLSTMSLLLEEMGEAARDVRVLFITVDPERDTPEVMRDYVSNFANGIVGLTGSPEQIAAAAAAFRAYVRKVPQEDGTYTVDHTASILLLDRAGSFRGTIDIHESPSSAAEKVRRLLGRRTQSGDGSRAAP